jgi:hypothetical protein
MRADFSAVGRDIAEATRLFAAAHAAGEVE